MDVPPAPPARRRSQASSSSGDHVKHAAWSAHSGAGSHATSHMVSSKSVKHSEETDVLSFLASDNCNPDLSNAEVRKMGCMTNRRSSKAGAGVKYPRLLCLQSLVGKVVMSWPVQAFVFMVVIFDMVLTGMSMGKALPENHKIFTTGDISIVCILAADVCCRWFAHGMDFIFPMRECKLNIFEVVLVPITIAEITVLSDEDIPLPILRALRPILRSVRLLRVLIRTAGKGQQYLIRLRHQVSGNRTRLIEDGVDLDLQYISKQIIVMSDPSVGSDAILRNPLKEVARYLNDNHGNQYLVLNVTEGRRYPIGPFFGRYYQFPIAQDSVPSLEGLKHIVKVVDLWLKEDPRHVVAVHSKHNQGRVAVFVIALLLYRKVHRSAGHALISFENLRKKDSIEGETSQTLDSASQKRFLEYFAHMCSLRSGLPQRSARITRIQLSGVSNAHLLDLSCFRHEGESKKENSIARLTTVELGRMMENGEETSGNIQEERVSLQKKVLNAIEEGAMDSRRSGAAPLQGEPVFSSKPELLDADKVVVRTVKNSETGVAVARIWELKDVELAGDIRLELHGRGTAEDNQGESRVASSGGWRCFHRRVQHGFKRQFSGGMLFGCWLHTALLEHDEVKDKRTGRKPGNRIEICLERFGVDKAAQAPALRAQSTAMKLEIEFHVDYRVQLRDLDAQTEQTNLVTSNFLVSEPETMHWLTWVSDKIWPNFKRGFEKMLKDSVESARPGLPRALQSLNVVDCSFGDAYPQFGPVHASSRNHTMSADADDDGLEVQLDIGLRYSADSNIILQAGLMSFGISHIKLNGVLCLRFTPLLDEIPVFSAMQMFFLNAPEIDIRFKDMLEVANTHFIKDKIAQVINNAVTSRLVVPNLLNINWADPTNDETVTWLTVVPSFVVRVHVLGAKHLSSSSKVLTRDPETFARLSVGQHEKQTAVMKGEDPQWAEYFDFVLYDTRQHVHLQIFDKDFAGNSWMIGELGELDVEHLAYDVGSAWRPLKGLLNPDAGSKVHLTATVFDLAPNPLKLPPEVLKSQPKLLPTSLDEGDEGALFGEEEEEEGGEPLEPGAEDGGATDAENSDVDLAGRPVPKLEPCRSISLGQGSVALLVCTVLGGYLPVELGQPSEVVVTAKFGSAEASEPGQDSAEGSGGNLSEKTQKRIARLVDKKGYSAAEIAEALDEEPADVVRCIRRSSSNLSVQQKLCLHLDTADFMEAQDIRFSVLKSRSVLAEGTFRLSRLLESSIGQHEGVVVCKSEGGQGHDVKLDIEIRLLTLLAREVDVDHGLHSPGSGGMLDDEMEDHKFGKHNTPTSAAHGGGGAEKVVTFGDSGADAMDLAV